MPLDQLLGPVGALTGAILIIAALWREHLRSDARESARADEAQATAAALAQGTKELADAWRTQAEAWKAEADRRRGGSTRTR